MMVKGCVHKRAHVRARVLRIRTANTYLFGGLIESSSHLGRAAAQHLDHSRVGRLKFMSLPATNLLLNIPHHVSHLEVERRGGGGPASCRRRKAIPPALA